MSFCWQHKLKEKQDARPCECLFVRSFVTYDVKQTMARFLHIYSKYLLPKPTTYIETKGKHKYLTTTKLNQDFVGKFTMCPKTRTAFKKK